MLNQQIKNIFLHYYFVTQIRENLKMLVPDAPRQTCRGRIRLKIVWDQKEKDKVRVIK